MSDVQTEAQRLVAGDAARVAQLATTLLKPLNDNLVERPWGGRRILDYKRLPGTPERRFGEAFELAADDADLEARQYPSRVRFDDGSELTLPALLEVHGETLLGAAFVGRYGRRLPLLPKTLDIAELLSVQGHPPGNTEVYVIIEADPGATIRLGFKADIDPEALKARVVAGRRAQQQLLELCGGGFDAAALQPLVQPWLATRRVSVMSLKAAFSKHVSGSWQQIAGVLSELHALYWHVLDLMNEIPVVAGQIIHNATPQRLVVPGRETSAEVHALGNPLGREILALEVRRPGPTFRAWDNVRFPIREIDVDASLAALNLRATEPEEFVVEPRAVTGRPGVTWSIDSEQFRIEHLTPEPESTIDVPAEGPHTLHAIDGMVAIQNSNGVRMGTLARGESALVPIGVGAYRVRLATPFATVVKVSLPLPPTPTST